MALLTLGRALVQFPLRGFAFSGLEAIKASQFATNLQQLYAHSTEVDPELLHSGLKILGESVDGDASSNFRSSPSNSSSNTANRLGGRRLPSSLPQDLYKAILLGEVKSPPAQRVTRSGYRVTLFTLGTGGLHNTRKPFNGETAEEYTLRCSLQGHCIVIYDETLGNWVKESVKQGSQMYVEGNIEVRVYNDPVTGLVKRINEIAVRKNGRVVLMGPKDTIHTS